MSEIRYVFKFEDDKKIFEYILNFDEDDYAYIPKQGIAPPRWTVLDNKKCHGCPLKSDSCAHCPIAVNLAEFLPDIKEMLSYKKVTVVVIDKNRSYIKKTDLQSGLFSMFGLIMAASDCPHMQFLRPLARFHLPFSSVDETICRVSSMHLLSKFVKNKHGAKLEMNLKSLMDNYKKIELVNEGMLNRIRAIERGDAGKNAIVALNLFAQIFTMEFRSDLSMIDKLVS